MKSTDKSFTEPAMEIVRKADPDLAERIDAAPEPLTVVTDPVKAAADVLPEIGPVNAYELALSLASSLGTTVRPGSGTPLDGYSWLTEPYIKYEAAHEKLPVDELTSAVIVHEFRHHDGGLEPEAYAAGTEFARKVGDPKLVKYEEEMQRDHGQA